MNYYNSKPADLLDVFQKRNSSGYLRMQGKG